VGFFQDLFGPLKPCDVCQLGRATPIPGQAGTVDWKIDINVPGISVRRLELLICGQCRRLIKGYGLVKASPMVVMGKLIAAGLIPRPPAEAYLNHPVWGTMWHYLLQNDPQASTYALNQLPRIVRQVEQTFIDTFSPKHESK
jgi:hypothetical protein